MLHPSKTLLPFLFAIAGGGTCLNTETVFPFHERVFSTVFWTLFPTLPCSVLYEVQLVNPKCRHRVVEARRELE